MHARIPFTIIGVFLIIGSSVTTVYLSQLEMQKSQEIARSLDYNEIEQLLYDIETDVTTALTMAGLKGLKEIGKNPVINTTIGLPEEVNRYRVKEIIKAQLNVYLTGHYLDNMFSNGRYAINVVLHNESPIVSAGNITLESLTMQIQRTSLPLIGPNETRNHTTYWVASVPLDFEVRCLQGEHWEVMMKETIVIRALLTSRFPLLECLEREYSTAIDGVFSPLWTMTTGLLNLYTLARGFKHYRCGKPLNIMDNRHLSVIINSGLLLQQSLVFGSVDPLSIVELAKMMKQVLQQQPHDALTTFNSEMEGEGYHVNTENLTEGSANVDAGSSMDDPIDQRFSLNLSEIAERILYNITSVTLHFENARGEYYDERITFDGDIRAKLDEALRRGAAESYFVTHRSKHLEVNLTAFHRLQSIISPIYLDSMATTVVNRTVVSEQVTDPGSGWIDGGTGPWEPLGVVSLIKQNITPSKGHVAPGCALYLETYNVSYTRKHYWWRIEQQTVNGTFIEVTIWNNISDFLFETVALHLHLQQYSIYQNYQNDIIDVLYVNQTVDDPNLADTLSAYLERYPDTHLGKYGLIVTRNNIGVTDLQDFLPGSYRQWVIDDAWSALDNIFHLISKITLDPSINTTTYPNPAVLLQKAQDNLETQYNEQRSDYLRFSEYHPGNEFLCAGKKAIYCVREWYVNLVKNTTEKVFSELSTQIMEGMAAAIPDDAGFCSQNITETIEDTSEALQNQFTIPFGYDMTLTRYNHTNISLWNETVHLAIDQQPNYLDPFHITQGDGEELWTLKLRNRCIFGPTGLPLLPPSPVTPWLLTLNLWVIDVEGEYVQLKIIDTSDETIFNPLIGHEPQTYVREMKIVSVSNTTLGTNTRVSFKFTTLAFGIVPPWGMMIGDIQDNWFDDHTPGFNS